MTLAKIVELLPVPTNTSENARVDWSELPEEFGGRFPDTYVDFVSTYGTGSVGAFFWVLNPFSKNPSLNLGQASYFRNAYQSLRDEFPQYYRRHSDDFLPWGFTDNGDAVVWLTDEGDPNEWCVCVQASDPAQEEVTGLNTQAFLEALLEKKLASTILPIEFLQAEKKFVTSYA
jgi:hypothetical protein